MLTQIFKKSSKNITKVSVREKLMLLRYYENVNVWERLPTRNIGHNSSKFKVIIENLVFSNNYAKRKIFPETY